MNKRLENDLIAKFPLLYRNFLYFGCRDGWFNLILNLSKELEYLISVMPDRSKTYCVVCKSKFGGLRFHVDSATKEMQKLIDETEDKSITTCEDCGAWGKCYEINKWIYTFCEECYKSEMNIRNMKDVLL